MRVFALVLTVLVLWPMAAYCADLDSVEADVSSKWDKLQSMTYDTETTMNMTGQGFSMSSASSGKVEMKRKDEKRWLMRMESRTDTSQTVGGNSTKSNTATLMIVDTEFSYTLTDTAGQKMAMKSKAQDWSDMAGGKGFFKWLREHYDVKALPDENVDGVPCYALEAAPKDKAAGQGPTKYCFTKDLGMTALTESKGPDGKVISTTKLKNIKTNPSLADDRFVFTPPAGVTVMDMTKN